MKKLKSPQQLSFECNLPENGKNGCKDFDLYLIASVIDEKTGIVKIVTFLHVAGVEARHIYNTFNILEDEAEDLEVLIKTYQDYVEPHNNLTYLRHIFITRNQETHETIDTYVTDLKNKATLCEFGNLRECLIRDYIVCGIYNEAYWARLLRESDLPLAK